MCVQKGLVMQVMENKWVRDLLQLHARCQVIARVTSKVSLGSYD
jgi:hypothetical protein